ncbi:MAG: hypothetical protein R3C03_03140 [Pirellulaceae bacterium]
MQCNQNSWGVVFFLILIFGSAPVEILAQQIDVGLPFNSTGDSYFENHGVNFGFNIPGRLNGAGQGIVGFGFGNAISFGQNSAGGAIPSFGGYDPNSAANFGFASRGRGGGGFSLGFNFAKGSSRTATSTVPSMVVQNGMGGSMFDGQLTPFVTGVVPVVGAAENQTPVNGVTLAMASGQLDFSNLGDPNRSRSLATESYDTSGTSTANTAMAGVDAIRQRKEMEHASREAQVSTAISEAEQLIDEQKWSEARRKLQKPFASLTMNQYERF